MSSRLQRVAGARRAGDRRKRIHRVASEGPGGARTSCGIVLDFPRVENACLISAHRGRWAVRIGIFFNCHTCTRAVRGTR
jgi:hypothetical protein